MINGKEVAEILTMESCIAVMETVLADLSEGRPCRVSARSCRWRSGMCWG